jgi:predicted RNase H-like nuclease (RuvC/YqgF family)
MKKESEQSRKRERARPGRKADRLTDREREMERLDFQVERFSIKSSHLLMGAEEAKRRSSQLSQRLQSASHPPPQNEGRRRDEQEKEKAQGRFLFSSPKDCNLPPPLTPGRREEGS